MTQIKHNSNETFFRKRQFIKGNEADAIDVDFALRNYSNIGGFKCVTDNGWLQMERIHLEYDLLFEMASSTNCFRQ